MGIMNTRKVIWNSQKNIMSWKDDGQIIKVSDHNGNICTNMLFTKVVLTILDSIRATQLKKLFLQTPDVNIYLTQTEWRQNLLQVGINIWSIWIAYTALEWVTIFLPQSNLKIQAWEARWRTRKNDFVFKEFQSW